MKEINKEEMKKVEGGSTSAVVVIVSAIAVFVSFITGALSGYANPSKCKN